MIVGPGVSPYGGIFVMRPKGERKTTQVNG